MFLEKTWRWQFLTFRWAAGGSPVQDWYDTLPDEPDRYEIRDLMDALQKANDRLWPDAVFDPLRGEGGISEIKIPGIRCLRDGKAQTITYRFYGFFGPKEYPHSYTFLHATAKQAKNDVEGKQLAKGRFHDFATGIESGRISIHKFEFTKRPSSKVVEWPSRPS